MYHAASGRSRSGFRRTWPSSWTATAAGRRAAACRACTATTRGAHRVREIVEACPDLGIKYLTLFAFSTENWKRPAQEVIGLMRLFRRYIQQEGARLVAEGVRVRFIGDRDQLDADLVR